MHALGNDTAQKRNFKTNMFAQLNIHVMYQFLNSTKRKIELAVDRHRGAPKQEARQSKIKERARSRSKGGCDARSIAKSG